MLLNFVKVVLIAVHFRGASCIDSVGRRLVSKLCSGGTFCKRPAIAL